MEQKDFSSIDVVQYNAYLFRTALYLKAGEVYEPVVMGKDFIILLPTVGGR